MFLIYLDNKSYPCLLSLWFPGESNLIVNLYQLCRSLYLAYPLVSISHPWSFPTIICILFLVWILKTCSPLPNMLLCFHRGEPQIFYGIPFFLSRLALSELRFSYFSVEFLQQSPIWTHSLLPYVHDIHSAGVLSWEFRSKHNAPMLKTLPRLPSLYEKTNNQPNKQVIYDLP